MCRLPGPSAAHSCPLRTGAPGSTLSACQGPGAREVSRRSEQIAVWVVLFTFARVAVGLPLGPRRPRSTAACSSPVLNNMLLALGVHLRLSPYLFICSRVVLLALGALSVAADSLRTTCLRPSLTGTKFSLLFSQSMPSMALLPSESRGVGCCASRVSSPPPPSTTASQLLFRTRGPSELLQPHSSQAVSQSVSQSFYSPNEMGRREVEGRRFVCCYMLHTRHPQCRRNTYIGYTVNPRRRIRQHNGELKAPRTKKTFKWV